MTSSDKPVYKKRLVKIFVPAAICAALFLLIRGSGIEFQSLTPAKIREYLLSFGTLKGALIYLVIYIFSIRPFIPIPPTLYTLTGGLTFGPVLGTILTLIGATVNASLCFLVARALGKDFAEKISSGKFDKLKEKLGESGFKTLLLIRTSPIGPPFDLVSYGSGVLKISFWSHFAATLIGIIPATVIYSYFGDSITKGSITKILVAFFIVVVMAVGVPWYLKKRRKPEEPAALN